MSLGATTGFEELKTDVGWREPKKRGRPEARQRAAALAEGKPDRRVQLWLQAKPGGERMTDLAREFGYRDGSGVLQVVKRLETRSGTDKALARQMRRLRLAFDMSVSGVQR